VVGMLIGSQIAEGHIVVRGLLDATRTGHANAVAIKQQTCQHKRVVCGESPAIVPLAYLVDRRQIQLIHHVGHKSSEVIFRQPVLERRRD